MPSTTPNLPDLSTEHESARQIDTCPHCGRFYRVGELLCSHCGMTFSTKGKTQIIAAVKAEMQPIRQARGNALVNTSKAISLDIETQKIALTINGKIVLGRANELSQEYQPDVDLSSFRATEKGVSRRHLAIFYNNELLYVSDLGSSNGTWLNGKKLMPKTMHLLRDGDEIEIGALKLRIYFK